jgi:hypothetical protein
MTRQNEMALTTRLKDLNETSSNVRVVDRAATRDGSVSDRARRLNLILGVLIGLSLGIGSALFLDYVDNTIASAAEVDRLVKLPVLAVVPHHGRLAGLKTRRQEPTLAETVDLIAHRDRGAGASEAYRELRTAILLFKPRPSTTADHGDERASRGRQVLDGDEPCRCLGPGRAPRSDRRRRSEATPAPQGLRRRRGAWTLGLPLGLETDPLALAQRTAIEGLDVLVSGPVPPDRRSCSTLRRLRRWGSGSSPAGTTTWSMTPLRPGGGRPRDHRQRRRGDDDRRARGRTPRESLQRAVAKFVQAGTRPIGIVLNDLDAGRHGYGTYGYYGRPENRAALG